MELYAQRTFSIDTENAFKIGPYITHLESLGTSVIKLNLGEPDFNLSDSIKEEIKHQLDRHNTHYCDPKGLLSLRKAIANQVSETRNIPVSSDQVVVFPGAKPSIGFSQQIYCDPNDEVIYPSPGFPIYESFIHYVGANAVPILLSDENGFAFDVSQFEKNINSKTKLIFLNFPSNPTGNVATESLLSEIASIVLKKCHPNARVYSDEIYERILYDGLQHHSIASIPGMEKRTIISSGFSKTYAWTGGRIGYAVLPSAEEADVFKNLNINYFSCIPPYNQVAARIALENQDAEKDVINMVRTFEERRNSVIEMLDPIKEIHYVTPKGAFYFFINISKVCKALNIEEAFNTLSPSIQKKTSLSTLFQMFALFHHHVAVLDRKSFGRIGSENQHYIRISFATDIEQLKIGIERLKKAFQDKQGFEQYIQAGKHLY